MIIRKISNGVKNILLCLQFFMSNSEKQTASRGNVNEMRKCTSRLLEEPLSSI
jgi:hypothetical protein